MTRIEFVIGGIIVAIILAIILGTGLLIADLCTGHETGAWSCAVVSRQFTPERVGVGSGTTGKRPVVVSTYEPEKWTAVVRCGEQIVSADMPRNDWADAKEGDAVTLHEFRGKFLGLVTGHTATLQRSF